MRLCDVVDIKSAFMKKADLSEEEIQTIIDKKARQHNDTC